MARKRRWSNGRSAELVGVAPSIDRCGEASRIGGWGLVAQSRMRTASVVVGDPAREAGPGVVETAEQRLVQKLVRHAPVEALADAVLHGARIGFRPVEAHSSTSVYGVTHRAEIRIEFSVPCGVADSVARRGRRQLD
jgi:hypothetical protein